MGELKLVKNNQKQWKHPGFGYLLWIFGYLYI